MKLAYTTCVGVLGMSLIVALSSCGPPPVTRAPNKSTEARLKNVQAAMRLLEESNRASIGDQLGGVSQGGTLRETWALLLIRNARTLKMEEQAIRDFLCRDGWGKPLNMDFKTNLFTRGASAKLLEIKGDVLVWSSGRNGINELGNGDDVLMPPQATDPEKGSKLEY